MAHMTRAEIIELHNKLKQKTRGLTGHGPALDIGLDRVYREVSQAEGPAIQMHRDYGRLMKHYLEDNRSRQDMLLPHFNVALTLCADGMDVQLAIRRARVRLMNAVEEVKREFGYAL